MGLTAAERIPVDWIPVDSLCAIYVGENLMNHRGERKTLYCIWQEWGVMAGNVETPENTSWGTKRWIYPVQQNQHTS